MDIIGIYLLDQNMGMAFVKVQMYTYTIGIGKVAICFKPFGFLFDLPIAWIRHFTLRLSLQTFPLVKFPL